MAVKRTSSPPEEASEIQAAAALILRREETRQQAARARSKRRRRQRRQAEREAIQKMHRSIDVIKWCVVAICTVWVISFVISIIVLFKVQSKVAEIQGQVQHIRHVMDNPFASAGARLGGQVDDKLKELFRLPDQSNDDK